MDDVLSLGLLEKDKPQPWLMLREELSLHQGPLGYDGSPTWTLYDPAVHRYFRIGWLEFECLRRWGLGDAEQIATSIQSETTLFAESTDIEQLIEFLSRNNLTQPLMGYENSQRFAETNQLSKPGIWTWLLHNYLFFRVPLIKPDPYLKRMHGFINLLFTRQFLILLCFSASVAVYLVAQQWSLFSHSFMYNLTPEGLLATVGMMSLSKVVHEMGHAFAASQFGCRVPSMGVALLLGMPVLWTDVTDAWRLPRRRDRLIIDAAGIIAELSLAVVATILWTVLPDGAFRSGSYLLASTAWLITLTINLNPFMRFDGYHLIADAWDIPNLQDRSFALARWRLRESLFGFGLASPEHWSKSQQKWLVIYAFSIWIYRLILFTGIAWAVYYFFFKVLGLFLFAVEIGWFVLRPIWAEVGVWRNLFTLKGTPIRPRPSWLIPLIAIAALFIPWRSNLIVPGLFIAEAEHMLYAVEAAQVKEVLVKEGDNVVVDQVILKLESPDLDYKIRLAELKWQELKEQLSSQSVETKLARNNPKDFEELQSVVAEIRGYRSIKEKLQVRATFNGRIRDLSDAIVPGEWLAKDEPIGLVKNASSNVVGYVEEADLAELIIGGEGVFYPEGGDVAPMPVQIISIDGAGARELKIEELASIYGGELAVRQDAQKRLIPAQGIYRILLSAQLAPQNTLRGRMSLNTTAKSVASRLIRLITITLIKESGW